MERVTCITRYTVTRPPIFVRRPAPAGQRLGANPVALPFSFLLSKGPAVIVVAFSPCPPKRFLFHHACPQQKYRKLLFLPVSAILPKPCPCFCAVSPKVCGGGAGIWRMGRAAWYYCYQKYFPAAPVHTLFCAPPCLIPAGIPARRSFGGSHREKKGSAKPQSGSRRPAVRMFALLFSAGSLRQWYGRFFREM